MIEIVKELLKGFTKKEIVIYGILAPATLVAVCILAEAILR